MPQGMLHPEFQRELAQLINRHSLDNACDTPDFILAGMVTEFIESYARTMRANIDWHAPSPIGRTGAFTPPDPKPTAAEVGRILTDCGVSPAIIDSVKRRFEGALILTPPVGPRLDGR